MLITIDQNTLHPALKKQYEVFKSNISASCKKVEEYAVENLGLNVKNTMEKNENFSSADIYVFPGNTKAFEYFLQTFLPPSYTPKWGECIRFDKVRVAQEIH